MLPYAISDRAIKRLVWMMSRIVDVMDQWWPLLAAYRILTMTSGAVIFKQGHARLRINAIRAGMVPVN